MCIDSSDSESSDDKDDVPVVPASAAQYYRGEVIMLLVSLKCDSFIKFTKEIFVKRLDIKNCDVTDEVLSSVSHFSELINDISGGCQLSEVLRFGE